MTFTTIAIKSFFTLIALYAPTITFIEAKERFGKGTALFLGGTISIFSLTTLAGIWLQP